MVRRIIPSDELPEEVRVFTGLLFVHDKGKNYIKKDTIELRLRDQAKKLGLDDDYI